MAYTREVFFRLPHTHKNILSYRCFCCCSSFVGCYFSVCVFFKYFSQFAAQNALVMLVVYVCDFMTNDKSRFLFYFFLLLLSPRHIHSRLSACTLGVIKFTEYVPTATKVKNSILQMTFLGNEISAFWRYFFLFFLLHI